MRRLLALCLALGFLLSACATTRNPDRLSAIKNNMTEAQVKSILGRPDRVEKSEILGLKAQTYLYGSGDNAVKINFINNRVSSKHGRFE